MRETEQEDAIQILKDEFNKSTCIDEFDLSGTDRVFDVNRADNVCPACSYTFTDSIAICPDCGLVLGAGQ